MSTGSHRWPWTLADPTTAMTPVATREALGNSIPKSVKAVLENNGGHTKYWHFGPNLDILT